MTINETIDETITSARPSNDHDNLFEGSDEPGMSTVVLSAEMAERIQRHDMNYRSECAWCVQLRTTGGSLSILVLPLHVVWHLPIASMAGLTIQYCGTPSEPGGVLVSLHNHDIAQVVGIASALGVFSTSAYQLDSETVSVHFGEWNHLSDGVSLRWFAKESDVKDILTLFPGLDIKGRP